MVLTLYSTLLLNRSLSKLNVGLLAAIFFPFLRSYLFTQAVSSSRRYSLHCRIRPKVRNGPCKGTRYALFSPVPPKQDLLPPGALKSLNSLLSKSGLCPRISKIRRTFVLGFCTRNSLPIKRAFVKYFCGTPARKTMDFCVFPRFSTITAGPRPIRRLPGREHVPRGTNVFLPENSFEKGCGMTPQGHTAALLLPVAALRAASVCRQGASIYSYIFPYR